MHPCAEPASYPILFNLGCEPGRVSMLADCIHSDVSTVSRQVAMLRSHGLLERVAGPQDGRAFMVWLSPEGGGFVERLMAARGDWLRLILHDWERTYVKAFNDHLTR